MKSPHFQIGKSSLGTELSTLKIFLLVKLEVACWSRIRNLKLGIMGAFVQGGDTKRVLNALDAKMWWEPSRASCWAHVCLNSFGSERSVPAGLNSLQEVRIRVLLRPGRKRNPCRAWGGSQVVKIILGRCLCPSMDGKRELQTTWLYTSEAEVRWDTPWV